MKVKFVIPVMDTESGNYEYTGRNMTMDDYFNMLRNRVSSTNDIMDNSLYGYDGHVVLERGGFGQRNLYDSQNVNLNKEIKYDFSESEAWVTDADGDDIEINDLENYIRTGKKFLLKVNVNPNSLENDAESELRSWMDDSNRVLEDHTLDNRTMLLTLPLHDFILDTAVDGDESKPIFQILGCKIIQIYNPKKTTYPYYFAIMIEKIIKQS